MYFLMWFLILKQDLSEWSNKLHSRYTFIYIHTHTHTHTHKTRFRILYNLK